MTDVVIPIKGLDKAKGRLGPVLSPEGRAGLVLAMLRDVLTTLRRVDLGDIWLVASDDAVFDLGSEFGVRNLRERAASGYNNAVSLGLGAVPIARPSVAFGSSSCQRSQPALSLRQRTSGNRGSAALRAAKAKQPAPRQPPRAGSTRAC